MYLEYELNKALNKALCGKNRIKNPNSNLIAEFVTEFLKEENKTRDCIIHATDMSGKCMFCGYNTKL